MHTSLIIEELKSTQDELYDFFWKVYKESFDINERRTPENLALEMQNPNANVCVIRAVLHQIEPSALQCYTNGNDIPLVSKTMNQIEHSIPVGILIYWDFPEFTYLGHFAIAADLRNLKLGGQFLKDFINDSLKPIILEVEHPDTDIAARRIGFYERIGLKLCKKNYMQPAYATHLQPVPLYLMETADSDLLEKDFDKIVNLMHSEIYWESPHP